MTVTFFTDPDIPDVTVNMTATHAGWIMESLGYEVDYSDIIAGEVPTVELHERIASYVADRDAGLHHVVPIGTGPQEVERYVDRVLPFLATLAREAKAREIETIYWS
jgi:hypothetical protein